MPPITIGQTTIVIIAAGNSSRLGSPKQLLNFRGKSLLQNAVEAAVSSGSASIRLVLGAAHQQLQQQVHNSSVNILYNPSWKEGMASSIRYALQNITEDTFQPESVIFMVCDQPFVTGNHLQALVNKCNHTQKPIVASWYANKPGTPALFCKSMFPVLMQLTGDKGARAIFTDYIDQVAWVPFPKGETDIDTLADYDKLKQEHDC